MNENLYEFFEDVFSSDYSIKDEGIKKIINLNKYGKLETYSLFPGIVLAFIDVCIDNYDNVNRRNFSVSIIRN